MAVSTRSFIQLVEAVAEQLGVLEQGTLTAASTTLLTIASGNSARYFRNSRANASDRVFEGTEVYATSGTVPVPNPNIISAQDVSAGTLTPGVTYGTAPDATSTFDLFLRGVRIQWIKNAINLALRQLSYETLVPLTMVIDGDMDTSGTTDWAATNATLSKVTGATTVYQGSRALRVLATAGVGFAQSATLLVNPTYAQQWRVRAIVRADVGTARLNAYDVTNSAAIVSTTGVTDYALRGWGTIEFAFSLPATCEGLAFRLTSVANADDTYWDSLIAFPVGAHEFSLPDWVIDRGQIRHLRSTRQTLFRVESDYWERVGLDIVADQSNPNRMFKVLIPEGLTKPLMFEALRPYDTLSADADTAFCPRELIEPAAIMEVCKFMKNRPGQNQADWNVEYQRRLTEWKQRRIGMGPQVISRIAPGA